MALSRREILRQLLSGSPVSIAELRHAQMKPFCFFRVFPDFIESGMYGAAKRITFEEFQQEMKCCTYPIVLTEEDYKSDPIE